MSIQLQNLIYLLIVRWSQIDQVTMTLTDQDSNLVDLNDEMVIYSRLREMR